MGKTKTCSNKCGRKHSSAGRICSICHWENQEPISQEHIDRVELLKNRFKETGKYTK